MGDNFEQELKHMQAINQLLTDYSQSQALLIKQLKNAIVTICICFTVIICVMIGGFFWYESQFETKEVTTTELSTEGDNADINSVTNGNMYNDNAVHNE